MSFGFGIGDFMGAAQIAYTLEILLQSCQGCTARVPAPRHRHQHPLAVAAFPRRRNEGPEVYADARGDRVRMMNEMLGRVMVTLGELQIIAEKYEKLGDLSRGKLKLAWSKFKWSLDATDLDALRNKVDES